MAAAYGTKVSDRVAQKLAVSLPAWLQPDELPRLVVRARRLNPVIDLVVVTDSRVLGICLAELDRRGPKLCVARADITGVEVRKKLLEDRQLVVATGAGETLFGNLDSATDTPTVLAALDAQAASTLASAWPAPAGPAPSVSAGYRPAAVQPATRDIAGTVTVGSPPNGKAVKAIQGHSAAGEQPWLIVGAVGAGCLAAFTDRLMIVKTGKVTSLMAGSFGGGRVTVIHYADITGIEYNAGLFNGVLEVLTPSYSGTTNKDFWRGSTRSRNANSDDPFALSNTLPLPRPDYAKALPHLNELRRMIAEAKRPHATVVVQGPAQAPDVGGIADELRRLAELHAEGILDEDEFREAKRSLIGRAG